MAPTSGAWSRRVSSAPGRSLKRPGPGSINHDMPPASVLHASRGLPADVWAEMGAAADLADELAAAGRRLHLDPAEPGGRLRARLRGPGGLDAELALRDVLDPQALLGKGVLSPRGPAAG